MAKLRYRLTSWRLIPRSLNGIAFNPQPTARTERNQPAADGMGTARTVLAFGCGLNDFIATLNLPVMTEFGAVRLDKAN